MGEPIGRAVCSLCRPLWPDHIARLATCIIAAQVQVIITGHTKKIKMTSSERALSIIKSPIMTEKSTNLNQFNKYSFFVSKNSNSLEIKQAIENIFKVKVLKVNTLINRGKVKSFKGSLGYKQDQKKAIVTLSEGNTIDSSLEIK